MATAFDERSGIEACKTPWGRWWQTMQEVYVEINVPPDTTTKQIKCDITTNRLSVVVAGTEYVQGKLPKTIHADESFWTLEDRKLLQICLSKSDQGAGSVWPCLVQGQFEANPLEFDKMEKKLTLERFQMENPGMDFSGATVSGNYHGGGPSLPS